MTYIVCPCQHCAGHIEFPEEGVGLTVECPHCGRETVLNKPATPIRDFRGSRPASPSKQAPEPIPEPVTHRTKRCPFCAESIQQAAIKCKHCGEYLDGRSGQAQKRPPVQSVSGGVFQGLFNFFIVLPLAIVLAIVGIIIASLIGVAATAGLAQWMVNATASLEQWMGERSAWQRFFGAVLIFVGIPAILAIIWERWSRKR